jgi:hypothetical protein
MILTLTNSKSFFIGITLHLSIILLSGIAACQQGSPMGHSRPLPDPRFRTVIGLNELQNIVNLIAEKNRLHVRVTVAEDMSGTVAIARVTGVALAGRIEVNP